MSNTVGIVDYGASNLLSVMKALDFLGCEGRVIRSKRDIESVDRLILPGVGAFQSAIERLKSSGVHGRVGEWLESDRPFLGICLGLQVLFEGSEESRGADGFGVFKGKVRRFRSRKVPQIGWNQVSIKKGNRGGKGSRLMNGIDDNSFFYFLHGYYASPKDESIVVGTTDYGMTYASAIEKGNICAVQFHPEKSGTVGLRLLRNWVSSC